MPIPNIRFALLNYWMDWKHIDDETHEHLRVDSPTGAKRQLIAMQDFADEYGITRCFPSNEEGAERFTFALDRLREIIDINDWNQQFRQMNQALRANYVDKNKRKSNKVSACSKFLWIRFREKFRIYDNNAHKALRKLDDQCPGSVTSENYNVYCEAWNRQFVIYSDELDDVLRGTSDLLSQFTLSWDQRAGQAHGQEPWFKERIFDAYLYNYGRYMD